MEKHLESSDLVTRLGYLCFGSRLKRLGERLQGGVQQVLLAHGHQVQPAQLPLLWALQEEAGPLTIGALSDRVGISQPGVSRAVAALEGMGLVHSGGTGKDKRQRLIAISPAGEALMASLAAGFFPAVQQAVERLCRAAGPDLLARIDRIEDDLAATPLEARVAALLMERTNG